MNVTACLVTRGDVDLDPILDSLRSGPGEIDECVVWENGGKAWYAFSQRRPSAEWKTSSDMAVYGRYEAATFALNPVVYVQDDDCVLPRESLEALLAAYQPGHVVCNMPQDRRRLYPDSALLGFGAVFDRDLPDLAFNWWSNHKFDPASQRWLAKEAPAKWFLRVCDVIFTTLTPRVLVDVPYENLPHATANDRMYRQPTHIRERRRAVEFARQVRDAR